MRYSKKAKPMNNTDFKALDSSILTISGLPISLPLDTSAEIDSFAFDDKKDRLFEIFSPNFTVPSWEIVFLYKRSDGSAIEALSFVVTPSISGRFIVLVDRVLPPIVGGSASNIVIRFRPIVAAGHIGERWPIPTLSNLVNVNW
jgi:hypothetical protein